MPATKKYIYIYMLYTLYLNLKCLLDITSRGHFVKQLPLEVSLGHFQILVYRYVYEPIYCLKNFELSIPHKALLEDILWNSTPKNESLNLYVEISNAPSELASRGDFANCRPGIKLFQLLGGSFRDTAHHWQNPRTLVRRLECTSYNHDMTAKCPVIHHACVKLMWDAWKIYLVNFFGSFVFYRANSAL